MNTVEVKKKKHAYKMKSKKETRQMFTKESTELEYG